MDKEANENKNEKPRYYATDFPEIAEHISADDKKLYLNYANKKLYQNSDDKKLYQNSDDKELRKKLLATTQAALACLKKSSLDIRVTCPQCGKRHCFVKYDNGIAHCWSCGWSGCLEEMKPLLSKGSGKVNQRYYANAQRKQQEQHKDKNYVPMLPDDYQEISAETRSWLYPIYPFDDEEKQQQFISHFHPADLSSHCPKARLMLSAQQLASLQSMVQRYVEAMKFSPEVIKQEGVMCAWLKHRVNDEKCEDPRGVELVPAIAYCNYLYGKIINVKFRSVQQNILTGKWSKDFLQESPTKPCAPYGIDSINSLRPNAQPIDRLIITEGEKDRLTLMTCGFPYVLSIANGANTNIEQSHEAFQDWIMQADEIVICGDTDLPGRQLVKLLIDAYQTRAKITTLPQGKKDISEVYDAFGKDEVRRIIEEAQGVSDVDVFSIDDHTDEILDILMGHYDHGYDVGMGVNTDRIFHPTNEGGLIILTGIPNSGKTDFLNCLMAHLMYHCQKRVAFFSFEKPIKGKHVREIARIVLGVENTENLDGTETTENARQVNLQVLSYLAKHMVDFDTKSRLPDSDYIIGMVESLANKQKKPLDYLVIDPYVFINMSEGGSRATETEKVRLMLTKLQAWSRTRHIWTVVVAHPRIQNKEGSQDFPDLNIYSIAGSAQWANLADYLLTVRRIHKPEEGKEYSIVEMLKVRDQEFCHTGKVFYVRQPCGRYDERDSEADCIAESLQGKVLPKDESPWI